MGQKENIINFVIVRLMCKHLYTCISVWFVGEDIICDLHLWQKLNTLRPNFCCPVLNCILKMFLQYKYTFSKWSDFSVCTYLGLNILLILYSLNLPHSVLTDIWTWTHDPLFMAQHQQSMTNAQTDYKFVEKISPRIYYLWQLLQLIC